MIYLCYLLVFIYFTYKYDIKGEVSGRQTCERIAVFMLILLAGLRNHVGGDTSNYIRNFNEIPTLGELGRYQKTQIENLQVLWFLFLSSIKTIGGNFIHVQILHSLFVNCLIYRFIRHTTEKTFIALTIFLCIGWWNFNFEIMRESACVAIFLNASLYLRDGRIKKYILFVIPALFIHYFSFVPILLALLTTFASKRQILFALGGVTITFLILSNQLSDFFLQMANSTTDGENSQIFESYFTGDLYGQSNLNVFGIAKHLIILSLPSFLAFQYYKKEERVAFQMLSLYIVFYIFFIEFPVFSRFLNYLVLFVIVYSVNSIIEFQKVRLPKYFLIIMLVYQAFTGVHEFYSVNSILGQQTQYDIRYFPYKSVFEEVDPVREMYYY